MKRLGIIGHWYQAHCAKAQSFCARQWRQIIANGVALSRLICVFAPLTIIMMRGVVIGEWRLEEWCLVSED